MPAHVARGALPLPHVPAQVARGALPWPHVPAHVARGALVAHRHSFRLLVVEIFSIVGPWCPSQFAMERI